MAEGLPLSGIRVLELGSVWAVPGAGMYLADQGAEVVKVEPPEGDIGRTVTMAPPIQGRSRAFWSLNRNKRSLVANLKHPDGLEVVMRLAARSDVILHNFRPSAAQRLGLDYAALAERHPRLVYAAANAFGRHGPRAQARGYDLLVQAAAGVSLKRRLPDGRPQPLSIFAVDMATSMLVSYAVMLALFQRERTGRGQEISASLLQTGLALQLPEAVRVAGLDEPPIDATAPVPAVYSSYRCADGEYIQLAIASEPEWRDLCRALEAVSDLGADPRFATSESRLAHSEALSAALGERFATRTGDEWQRRLDENDAPGVKIERPESVFDSPQITANAGFACLDQPGIGQVTVVNTPFSLSDNPGGPMSPAPDLGQHTDAVLEELGYEPARIAELRRDAAVG